MDKYFRIALLFCFLLYSEQHPASSRQSSIKCLGLGIKDLKDVQCGPDVNFTSPTNVQKHCLAAALQTFEQQLKNATDICADKDERLINTLDALQLCATLVVPQNNQKNATACTWEKKPFASFVEDLTTLKDMINSL